MAGSSTYRIYDLRICNRIYQWKTVSGIWRAFRIIFNREENLNRKQQSPVTTGHAQITSFQFGIHGIHEVKQCAACFPPYCTHILQLLDDTPFALFKTNYQRQLMHVNRLMCGQRISRVTFFQVLVPAYTGAMTLEDMDSRIQECTPQMEVLRSSSKQPQVLFLINVSIDWNQTFMLDYVSASISMFC